MLSNRDVLTKSPVEPTVAARYQSPLALPLMATLAPPSSIKSASPGDCTIVLSIDLLCLFAMSFPNPGIIRERLRPDVGDVGEPGVVVADNGGRGVGGGIMRARKLFASLGGTELGEDTGRRPARLPAGAVGLDGPADTTVVVPAEEC